MEKNVVEFLNKCSGLAGQFEDEMFNFDMWRYCDDSKIESPIEQILYFAIKTIQRLNFLKDLKIQPQQKINNYRVDFLVSHPSK